MDSALVLTLIFVLPALVLHFLGKFFVALYLQPVLGEKRTVMAALSVLACSLAAPFIYLALRQGRDFYGEYNLSKVILFSFLPSAWIDLIILASYKKLEVKASTLFLAVDFVVAFFAPGGIVLAMLSNQ